jgi:hypothetical protein
VGKDAWCVWLTTYHLKVPMSRNLEALTSQDHLGPIGLLWECFIFTFKYSGTSVHEQIFRARNVSDDERCLGLRTRKLATAVGDKLRVSAREYQLLVNLAQYTSLLEFAVLSLEFHCSVFFNILVLLNKTPWD